MYSCDKCKKYVCCCSCFIPIVFEFVLNYNLKKTSPILSTRIQSFQLKIGNRIEAVLVIYIICIMFSNYN